MLLETSEGCVVFPGRSTRASPDSATWDGASGRRADGAEERKPAAGEGEARPRNPDPASQNGQAEPGGCCLKQLARQNLWNCTLTPHTDCLPDAVDVSSGSHNTSNALIST